MVVIMIRVIVVVIMDTDDAKSGLHGDLLQHMPTTLIVAPGPCSVPPCAVHILCAQHVLYNLLCCLESCDVLLLCCADVSCTTLSPAILQAVPCHAVPCHACVVLCHIMPALCCAVLCFAAVQGGLHVAFNRCSL